MKATKWLVGIILSLVVLLSACSQNGMPENTVPDATLEPEIVGGVEANAGAYPWMTRLLRNGSTTCGGSLLHQSWVLTAAHCVDGTVTAASLSVVLGDHQRSVNEGTEQTRTIAQIIIHPGFNATTMNNDLALLRLSTPVTLNARVGIVRIASLPAAGTMLRTIGWGVTSEGGVLADRLRQVDVPLVAQGTCADTYPVSGNPLDITASMFCAGPPEGLRDACQGDSGGPIFLPTTRYLVGLVSWGIGCARPDLFGVYTNLGRFSGWIYTSVPRPPFILSGFDLLPACKFNALVCKLMKDGLFLQPSDPINPCRLHPDLCKIVNEESFIPVIPDPICVYAICNNPLEITLEANYHIGLVVPNLKVTQSLFAQSFGFDLVDVNGKLVAQGKINPKVPLLEFSKQLPKGNYTLRVTVLNKDLAKRIQTAPQNYPFGLLFTAVK
jgi:Trypsin